MKALLPSPGFQLFITSLNNPTIALADTLFALTVDCYIVRMITKMGI